MALQVERLLDALASKDAAQDARVATLEFRVDQIAKRPGTQGPPGAPGKPPAHEWHGTQLRFELPSGKWGKYVDLQGPQGPPGRTFGIGGGAGSNTMTATTIAATAYVPTVVRTGTTFLVP